MHARLIFRRPIQLRIPFAKPGVIGLLCFFIQTDRIVIQNVYIVQWRPLGIAVKHVPDKVANITGCDAALRQTQIGNEPQIGHHFRLLANRFTQARRIRYRGYHQLVASCCFKASSFGSSTASKPISGSKEQTCMMNKMPA
ncbi:hypothetical protein D3C76_1226610 [compost metagenome]